MFLHSGGGCSRLYMEVSIKKTAGQKERAEKTEERCLVFFVRTIDFIIAKIIKYLYAFCVVFR